MTVLELSGFREVTIGADGTGTISGVGPTYPGETWHVERWVVNCTSPAQFRVVRGTNTEARYSIDTTTRGDQDNSETSIKLRAGEIVSFHWYSGTAGARATISWDGTREVPGRRGY